MPLLGRYLTDDEIESRLGVPVLVQVLVLGSQNERGWGRAVTSQGSTTRSQRRTSFVRRRNRFGLSGLKAAIAGSGGGLVNYRLKTK